MAIFSAYNLKNQKLSSDSLRSILQFCTDNYAGSIYSSTGNNPIEISSNVVTLTADVVDFIVGGYLLNYTKDDTTPQMMLGSDNNLFGLVINFDSTTVDGGVIQNTNIKENKINGVYLDIVYSLTGETTTNNISITQNNSGSFNIVDGDTTWEYKEDSKTFTNITLKNNGHITGNCIYIIPLAGFVNGESVNLLGYRTKTSLEEFLTGSALEKLKNELETLFNERFTWKSGGTDKGNIGNINITDNTIKSINDTERINFDTKYLNVENVRGQNGWALITNSDGDAYKGVVSVEQGGTGAMNASMARMHLGIYSGTTLPTLPNDNYPIGTIYLKII